MKHPALAVALLVALLAPGIPVASRPLVADESERFTVGVLRRDGRALPFAFHDGRRWGSKWPIDIRFVDVPISLASVPEDWWGKAEPPSRLSLWVDGENRGTVTLGSPEPMPIACERRLALKTDYKSKDPIPIRFTQPYPKEGLVVSGGAQVQRIEIVPRASEDWKTVTALAFEEFNKVEDRAAGSFTNWRHPMSARERRARPMEIEAIYKAPMDEGGTAYFVEAMRRYPPRPEDEGCGLVTLVSGWVLNGPKKPEFEMAGHVSYCDRRGAIYMLPLGLMRASNRTYWIYQLSGYGVEVYRISRPHPKGVTHEINYPAADCPSM